MSHARPRRGARRALVASLTGALAAALAPAACTFEDGRGWATLRATAAAELTVDEAHAPDAAAEEAGATFVTDQGYPVQVTELTARVVAVELLETASGAGSGGEAAPFDPASPPPGYTLCHAGHCHATDGRLVSYEDIEAELAGGGGASGPVAVATLAADGDPQLALDAAAVPLGPWETDSVSLSAAALGVRAVRLSGRVTLDGEAVPLEVTLADDADLALRGAVTERLGQDGVSEATLHFVVALPASWLDGVRFPNLERSDGVIRVGAGHNPATAELLAGRLAQLTPSVRLE